MLPATYQPNIRIVGEEVIISFPRSVFTRAAREPAVPSSGVQGEKKKPDFRHLIGALKEVKELPQFKGKSSVEIQHMITRELWSKRHIS